MRRVVWGLLVVAAIPVAARAADEGAPVPWANKFFVPKEPPPVVIHDFGTVPWGTTLTHRFPITNLYAVPVQIMSDPAVSCGCTKVVRYTQKLEPRETGYIDVEMDGRRFQGAKAVTISVQFGPKFRSTAVLQVRAFSRTDVTLNPGQFNFGVVALGQQPAQALDIQYNGQQINWQVVQVDTAGAPSVDVKIQRLGAARGAVTYRLTASLKADATPGVLNEQIVLKTNDASSPVVTVPIAGVVQAPLAVVQGSQVRLDPVPVGQETTRNVMVRGAKPFKIVKIEGEGDGLTAKYLPIQSPVQVVTITFKPGAPGELRRKLIIYTDQKDAATFLVEGSAEPAP
jgi:hypothetical protein